MAALAPLARPVAAAAEVTKARASRVRAAAAWAEASRVVAVRLMMVATATLLQNLTSA